MFSIFKFQQRQGRLCQEKNTREKLNQKLANDGDSQYDGLWSLSVICSRVESQCDLCSVMVLKASLNTFSGGPMITVLDCRL